MDAMKRKVMVVPREKLFPDGAFSGFLPAGGIDYGRRILSSYRYMARGEAEEDVRFKQPIGYALLHNPRRGSVFAYLRSSRDREYPEKRRLHPLRQPAAETATRLSENRRVRWISKTIWPES